MPTPTHAPPTTWDVFCHVIDNWGDLGVCWRLCADLASRGQVVRLWVDDPAPLAWMAPGALEGLWPGVRVHTWPQADAQAPAPDATPGQVLVEAFGCEVPPHWVAQLLPETGVWLNLEYLSAEPYVERCHGLPSPVMQGPLRGRTKWFFYPGFTPATGGLLREPDLAARQAAFDRHAWRAAHGVGLGDTVATLFCYEPPALAQALGRVDRWWVTPGRATAAVASVQAAGAATGHCTALPHLPQTTFDHALWASDLNAVRGEDTLVRALWAGQPLLWHIYPQSDNAHHAKLEAFLDWLDAPTGMRRWHRVWNGIDSGNLPPLEWGLWGDCVRASRDRLWAQNDLTTQLLAFVAGKR